MRLLLVDNDTEVAENASRSLIQAGFNVDAAISIAAASTALATGSYALVILDPHLSDGDGWSILLTMRMNGNATPVIIMSAQGEVRDRVDGLSRGADDYLIKPVDFDELIARVHALLRRPLVYLGTPIRAGNVVFDSVGRQVMINDTPLEFSAQNLALLELFVRQYGRVVSKAAAAEQLFGSFTDSQSNAVEVTVHRLRKQLENSQASVKVLTVHGRGYRMI